MYCRACGAAVGDDASFCAACGHRVERASAAVVEAKPAAYPRRAAAWLIDLPISLVPLVLLPLDYLWPLGHTRRRALHDLVAGTIVVDARAGLTWRFGVGCRRTPLRVRPKWDQEVDE